jgi:hypothetical protein
MEREDEFTQALICTQQVCQHAREAQQWFHAVQQQAREIQEEARQARARSAALVEEACRLRKERRGLP